MLIAGTFTPIHGVLFAGWRRWGFLALLWAAACCGIALEAILIGRMPAWMPATFYLALGWVGLASAWMLFRRFGWDFIAPLA